MLDVQTTFLNAEVEGFVKMTPGHGINDKAGVPLAIRLKRACTVSSRA